MTSMTSPGHLGYAKRWPEGVSWGNIKQEGGGAPINSGYKGQDRRRHHLRYMEAVLCYSDNIAGRRWSKNKHSGPCVQARCYKCPKEG